MFLTEDTISNCIWASLDKTQTLLRIDLNTFETRSLSYDISNFDDKKSIQSARIVYGMMAITDSTLLCRSRLCYFTINKNNGHIYRYWDSYDGLLERIKIKTVTVKRNILGEFFVYVTTDSPVTMLETRDGRGEVGMDFGSETDGQNVSAAGGRAMPPTIPNFRLSSCPGRPARSAPR